ncbi:hypothetical protein R1sor_021134 [Riccia sorocarpa]|uniref:Uncharacterized protein n=1 Tax=Riccia sorocarpa TaxID=122646 RepID=A0ABD3GG65_9MARC
MALVLSSPSNLGLAQSSSFLLVGNATVSGNARVCMLSSPPSSKGWGQEVVRVFEKNFKSAGEVPGQRSAARPSDRNGALWQLNVSSGVELASGGDSGTGTGGGFGDGKGGDGDSEDGSFSEGSGNNQNRDEALAILATLGRSLESLPKDLAAAVKGGKIPAEVVQRFLELEKSPIKNWLMRFGGFKERLLADDLFLTKVGIECGVGIFTKTAAELERRRENFGKELDFVVADVIMALVADFMLVWLPAPTVALRPALAKDAGKIAKFFYNCPDNAFQIAIRGTSYSTLQRVGAIVRNGSKLFAVGTSASLIGTAATNGLIKVRKTLDKNFEGESEDIPIVSTSLAYGVYMAVSSNLRYQLLAGVVEQRVLEPLLHNHKVALGVSSFAVRTANTFLGSLLWVDYARWVGVQKSDH